MEKPFSYMLEHPWLIAVAALVAYFLLRPSQSGGDGNASLALTLQSQKIASDANVALSAIAAQVAGVDAARITAANDAIRDITLAKIDSHIADKSLSVQREMNQLQTQTMNQSLLGNFATQLYDIKSGTMEALEGMKIQAASLMNSKLSDNAFAAMMSDKAYSQAPLYSQLALSQFNAEAQHEWDIYHDQQETIRNFAWRQKQIAKLGGQFGLLNNLMGGMFGLASQGLGMAGGGGGFNFF